MVYVESNLKQLLREAPSTRCGACGSVMEATSAEVVVSTFFDWRIKDADGLTFLPTDWENHRYSGAITYTCPHCGVELLHNQAVSLHADGFHFQALREEG